MTAVAAPELAVPREESAAGLVGRRLMVTWQDPETLTYHQVGWLTQYDDGSYGYAYLPSAQRLLRFHPFVGFREFDRSYYSSHLFPFFAQRLLWRTLMRSARSNSWPVPAAIGVVTPWSCCPSHWSRTTDQLVRRRVISS